MDLDGTGGAEVNEPDVRVIKYKIGALHCGVKRGILVCQICSFEDIYLTVDCCPPS